jgi:hypothetical protein
MAADAQVCITIGGHQELAICIVMGVMTTCALKLATFIELHVGRQARRQIELTFLSTKTSIVDE